jgi:tRNA threonylcarbamoyladenosine modification (KEOPS) complex  Pcc1 subunit
MGAMAETREKQVAEAMALSAMLREQGWGRVSIKLTGRTVTIDAEAADGAKVSGVVPLSRRQR